jgi:DNA gyrase subunit B
MRPLLESGYVYAAKPPLYRVKYNGKTYDTMTEIQKEEIVETKCNGNPTQIQRFKGLGEMNPEQLWNTTMDPDERWLKRITIEDGAYADKMFSVLMGDQVQPRKQFIRENATEAEWVDI